MRNKKLIFVGCFFLLLYILIQLYNKYIDDEINRFKVITVAKIDKIGKGPRGRDYIKFVYFYKGKMYRSGRPFNSEASIYLNKYYKLHLSSKNPQHTEIFLNQEIINQERIIEAGFPIDK